MNLNYIYSKNVHDVPEATLENMKNRFDVKL